MVRQRSVLARHPGPAHRQITQLKLLTTILPAAAITLYELLRDGVLGETLPAPYSYLLTAVVAVALTWVFSEFVFGIVERLEVHAVARSREVAALSAMMEERERLSRELHDGLAQLVAYLLVRIDTVSGLVNAGRRDDAVAELERLRGVTDDLYADVRESISGLRTRVSERGLLLAVREYIEEFEERHGITVDLHVDGLPEQLPPLAEFQLFRILQEALSNVRKHAGTNAAWVSFTCRDQDVLVMVVGDYGRGFEQGEILGPQGKRYGLATMRERTATAGGTFRVESRLGSGTRITVELPVRNAIEGREDIAATAARR